jgi:hypothetical protein
MTDTRIKYSLAGLLALGIFGIGIYAIAPNHPKPLAEPQIASLVTPAPLPDLR